MVWESRGTEVQRVLALLASTLLRVSRETVVFARAGFEIAKSIVRNRVLPNSWLQKAFFSKIYRKQKLLTQQFQKCLLYLLTPKIQKLVASFWKSKIPKKNTYFCFFPGDPATNTKMIALNFDLPGHPSNIPNIFEKVLVFQKSKNCCLNFWKSKNSKKKL